MTATAPPSAVHDTDKPGGVRRLTVVIADDHDIVREGLRRLLGQRPGLTVLGEASTGEGVLELVTRRRPDVVVMDARMPGLGGLQATRLLTQSHPHVHVIVFTAHSEQELLWDALNAGAEGFVLKDSSGATLLSAIYQVADGEPFVDPRLAPDVLRQLAKPRVSGVLSAREQEVLQMLADGASNRDVSEALVVSLETVKTHVKHILAKLEAEHRTHAVAIGFRKSLIR